MANEYSPDLYTLVDEEGKEQTFEVLADTEYEGETYYALTPYYENPEDELDDDGLLVILKSAEQDGEEFLSSVDDDAVFDAVAEKLMAIIEEIYDCECEDGEHSSDKPSDNN